MLKLLHPFIPFVTEEIYSHLPGTEGSIMVSEFPRYNMKFSYRKERAAMEKIMDVVKSVRAIKLETGAAPSAKVDLFVVTEQKKLLSDCSVYLNKLCNVGKIAFISSKEDLTEKVVSKILDGFEIYIPLGELVDTEKEIARLKAEIEKTENEIARANGKLSNQGFVSKAPKALIEGEKAKVQKFTEIREKLLVSLKELEA